jgi:isopentenyl-diphosphate delta-isomerase
LFLQKDVDVRPNPAEVSAVKWIKRENLEKEIASLDEPLTPWFELILKSGRLDLWWQSLRNLKKHEDYEKIHKLN